MSPMAIRASLQSFRRMPSIEIRFKMHFSWRDLETLSCEDMPSWRRYVRYPHLLFCAKCRKELKAHGEDRTLISNLKAAYAREERIHMIRTSRKVAGRS